MDRFFKKNPYPVDEKHAMKMIHEKIHESKHAFKKGEPDKVWLKFIVDAHSMLEDLMEIKGINPNNFKEKVEVSPAKQLNA